STFDQTFEFSTPGRIRTCAHGFRGPFPGIALTSRNVLAGVLTGRVLGAARRRPALQASPVGFRLTPHDRHPGFGEARSAAFNMGGNMVAEVAVRRGAGPGWCMRSYAQTRRPTDARICRSAGVSRTAEPCTTPDHCSSERGCQAPPVCRSATQ